ncbi:MAG TPA: hypothetical protein VKU85_12930 [bacterium]|nr:hypothetical protein [bacterium]
MKRILTAISLSLLPVPALAASVCIGPHSSGQIEATPCQQLFSYPTEWSGWGTTSGEHCGDTNFCTAVEWLPGYGSIGFSVSRSILDPFDTTGAATGGTVYLWLACEWGHGGGLASTRFSLSSDVSIASFTPVNGFLNSGTLPDVELTVAGCPFGPVLAGIIQLEDSVGLDRSGWGRVKALYR